MGGRFKQQDSASKPGQKGGYIKQCVGCALHAYPQSKLLRLQYWSTLQYGPVPFPRPGQSKLASMQLPRTYAKPH